MRKRKMAAQDLTIESLPHTRRELFFDIIKQRWKLLLTMGILFMVAVFPMVAVLFLRNFSFQNLYSSYNWATITEEQTAEYYSLYRQQNNFWNLFQLPCFIVIALFLSGFMRIIRQLNYSKGIYVWEDFKQGIKQNFLPYLGMFVFIFVLFYLSSFIANVGIENSLLAYLPIGAIVIIFVPILLNMLSLLVTYSSNFSSLVKNSFILSFKNILWYLLFTVAFFAPMALFLIPYYLIAYIVFLIISVIYYPLFFLANYLFNYASFDLYINEGKYPNNYHKGLF